jgi:hypothetical protein
MKQGGAADLSRFDLLLGTWSSWSDYDSLPTYKYIHAESYSMIRSLNPRNEGPGETRLTEYEFLATRRVKR